MSPRCEDLPPGRRETNPPARRGTSPPELDLLLAAVRGGVAHPTPSFARAERPAHSPCPGGAAVQEAQVQEGLGVRDAVDGADVAREHVQQLRAVPAHDLGHDVVAARRDDDVIDGGHPGQPGADLVVVGVRAQRDAQPGHRPEPEVQRVADGDHLQRPVIDELGEPARYRPLRDPELARDVAERRAPVALQLADDGDVQRIELAAGLSSPPSRGRRRRGQPGGRSTTGTSGGAAPDRRTSPCAPRRSMRRISSTIGSSAAASSQATSHMRLNRPELMTT